MDDKVLLDKISHYLRLDDAAPFLARVTERRNKCMSSLRGNSELIEIGRSQGRLEILDWILSLKED